MLLKGTGRLSTKAILTSCYSLVCAWVFLGHAEDNDSDVGMLARKIFIIIGT